MPSVVKTFCLAAVAMVLNSGLTPAQDRLSLAGTYIDHGYNKAGQPIPGGSVRTAVGPVVTVTCPGTSGTCTIQANHFIQVGHGSTSGNLFTAGFYVDGVANGDEQVLGSTPSEARS